VKGWKDVVEVAITAGVQDSELQPQDLRGRMLLSRVALSEIETGRVDEQGQGFSPATSST
jgi:hypothetical protein